jgi:hypothetical protein
MLQKSARQSKVELDRRIGMVNQKVPPVRFKAQQHLIHALSTPRASPLPPSGIELTW